MMHVLIDQTVGIPVPPGISSSVRKMRMKKGQELKEYLAKKENSMLKSKLPLVKRNLVIEVEELGAYLKEHGRVLYIYDGNSTDAQFLKRVRNWYLPEHVLQLVDGSEHRAYALYLLELLNEGHSLSSSLPPPSGYVISGKGKVGHSSYYKVGKKSKEKNFYFLHPTTKKMQKAPSPEVLLTNLVNRHPDTAFVAVGNVDLKDHSNVRYKRLHKWALPNAVSYLSIFPLPERSDDK